MKVSITKYEKVDLDTETMNEVTLQILRRIYDIPKDAFIDEESNLIVWHPTHGSGYDEKIRKATDEDKIIFKVMKRVKENKIKC